MRRFLLAGVVFAALLAPAGAVSTTTVTLTTAWTDLGAGPLQIQTNNQSQTVYQIGDAAPAAGAGGFFLQGIGVPQTVATGAHVYVRAQSTTARGAVPAVTYAPVVIASGGGGGGGTGGGGGPITSPLGSNTKANSVSTTFATDFLGQTTMAGSLPVVIASNQSALPVTVGNFPATQVVNNSQWGGVALGAATAYGTAPTGNVAGTNAFVTNFPATQAVSGTVTANQGAAGATPWPTTEADGANVTLGAKADTANAAVGSSLMAIERQLHADLIAATPAGTAIIGKVGIDQTTPGTTNKVSIGTDGTVAIGAGSAKIGVVTTDQTTHGTTDRVAADQYVGGTAQSSANPGPAAEVGTSQAAGGITPAATQAGTALVGKAAQGNLYSAYAVNQTTTAGYLVCINATAAPAAAAAITPQDVAYLPPTIGASATINFGAGPPNGYATGITCLITTSLTTYTAGGNAFMQTRVR